MLKSQQSVQLSTLLELNERPEDVETYELFLIFHRHCCRDCR